METYIIAIATLIAYFGAKTLLINDLSKDSARNMIREGAVVIDVRSEDEYQNAHIETAVNIPLNEISSKIGAVAGDKNKVILLHCRSGSRSFIGKRILKRMNYRNVYNLGSFGRAERMVMNEKNDRNI